MSLALWTTRMNLVHRLLEWTMYPKLTTVKFMGNMNSKCM